MKVQMTHVLATTIVVSRCHFPWSGFCVGASPVPSRTAYPPQAAESGVATAAGLSHRISLLAPGLDPGLGSIIVTRGRSGKQGRPEPEEPAVTTPQPIIQGKQQQDNGDTPANSPSVAVKIVTSVVTSTLTVQPSPAFNPGPNNPDNNGHPPGPPPGPGQEQKKTGLQPPPAMMQWVQCVLVTIEVAWVIVAQLGHWMGRLVRRKTKDKTGDEEKVDSDEKDSQDGKTPADAPGKSKAASTTDSASSSESERWSVRYILGLLVKMSQFNWKGPQPAPPGPCS